MRNRTTWSPWAGTHLRWWDTEGTSVQEAEGPGSLHATFLLGVGSSVAPWLDRQPPWRSDCCPSLSSAWEQFTCRTQRAIWPGQAMCHLLSSPRERTQLPPGVTGRDLGGPAWRAHPSQAHIALLTSCVFFKDALSRVQDEPLPPPSDEALTACRSRGWRTCLLSDGGPGPRGSAGVWGMGARMDTRQ